RWGYELTLMTVEITFATEDAVTNRGAKGIMDCHSFVEVIGMFDENALHMFWFIEQDTGKRPKMHATDIACTCHTLQEAQAVFSEVGQVSDKRVSTTNVTKRFEVVCICFDVSCHSLLLVNPTGA